MSHFAYSRCHTGTPLAPLRYRMRTFVLALILMISFAFQAKAAVLPRLILSVDWEGRDLRDENLQAMRDFRDKFPEVKLVHFLNAAYFVRPGVDATEVARKIRSVIREGDELGLHNHGWHSLFAASGVAPRSVEQFWQDTSRTSEGDTGHAAIIEDYSVADLRKVIHESVAILAKNGFHGLKSFRAGGWMGGSNVLEAIRREGFVVDSSAVPTRYLTRPFAGTRLIERLEGLWSRITPETPAFDVVTPGGVIREEVNTSGLADYVSGFTFSELYKSAYSRGNGETVHYGFHQETAARYLPEVISGLTTVKRYLMWRRQTLRSDTLLTRAEKCVAMFGSGR